MGITIHYEGSVESKEKLDNIIQTAETYSKQLNWTVKIFNEGALLGVVIFPHEKCEPVSLIFNKELKLSAFTKTQYAPREIHIEIVKLLYSLKTFFKKLIVFDESGFWDEYIDSFNKPTKTIEIKLPELSSRQIKELEEGFIAKSINEPESWFWNLSNKNLIGPIIDFSTICDLMRKDLSNNRTIPITFSEVAQILEKENVRLIHEIEPDVPEFNLISLVEAWIRVAVDIVPEPIKCSSFAWTISYGCWGLDGGYISSLHRKSVNYLEQLMGLSEYPNSPEITLRIFYSLLDFYKMKRKNF